MIQEAYSTHVEYLSELEQYVGKELGLTKWLVIDQKRINTFADATEDHQWIHVDPERSQKMSPYKTTIAHGFLILSLAPKFCYEILTIGDVTMGVNYGLDKVRFPKAVPANSEIRARISLMEFKKVRGGAKYQFMVVFEIKGVEKPACLAEFIGLAYTAS